MSGEHDEIDLLLEEDLDLDLDEDGQPKAKKKGGLVDEDEDFLDEEDPFFAEFGPGLTGDEEEY